MSSSFVERQETSRIISIMPRQKFEGHTHSVYSVIHLPGGRRIMTCSFDGSLRVWDLKSGQQIEDDWRDGDSGVWTIAMSPDGKKAVSGSMDGGVRLWDMDTGKVVVRWMGNTKPVSSVCWSGDGQRVLSGSSDGTAIQWDVESRETSLAPIKTGHEHMRAVVYSPDMTMLATGGSDNSEQVLDSLKIWDTKTGKLVATLETLERAALVLCLAWTPDGKTLISGSYHSLIRTWSTVRITYPLTTDQSFKVKEL
ncbi:WD40 repeat-like protein [Suillus hirtellus]|nr:WD40 repeat-like protein [Suillus hirtellus]